MQNTKLLDLLQSVLGQYKDYNDEYYFKCPFPECALSKKKKMAINLNAGDKEHYLQWHCWVCDNRGTNLYSLFKRINANFDDVKKLQSVLGNSVSIQNIDKLESNLYAKTERKIGVVSLPSEFQSFKIFSKNPEYTNAMFYLKKRNISLWDIVKYRMGYCPSGQYKGYIIIPSYDENMNLNYFIGRDYYGRDFRYKNPLISKNVVFNEVHINWNEPIVLCEGIFDAIAIKRNAIPLLGKTLNDSLRLKILEKKVKTVYMCLDKDAMKNSIKYIDELLKNDIDVYLVHLTGKDPSDLGFSAVNNLIKNAQKMEFSDLIKLKMGME